ncbi:hypothetical protein M2271_006116 [Streptomyces sp. LBL]|nr:hypothetical protein [Streptomyces sp. LBL]
MARKPEPGCSKTSPPQRKHPLSKIRGELQYTYLLDPATKTYRDGDVFTGVLKVTAPFPVEIGLGQI